ncbi:MAG: hypothetical protein IRY85_00960 [Micromonosporaceae bacterium]|nr:hypothetical protein [Micromonosporaceae bacterium]
MGVVVAAGLAAAPAAAARVAAADPSVGNGYRHASGLVVLPAKEIKDPSPLPEATVRLLSEARDLAESAPADFGYPWLDERGKVMVNVATPQGAERYSRWRPTTLAASAARGRQDVTVSIERFEQIRDDIAAQVAKHAPGFDHVLMVAPDGANNRLIVTVNSIDDRSLEILAKRYGTELVAVRYEPDRKPMTLTSGRFDDRSSPGGFYAGSAIRGPTSGCSSAFSWRSLDYTTSYMLTAGHCFDSGGLAYTAGPGWSTVEFMGTVTANTRENWNIDTGTTHLVGDLASPNAYRGDIALIEVTWGKSSSGNVYADPGAYSRRVTGSWVLTWSAPGDQFCVDGVMVREVCGWYVDEVGVDVVYHSPDGRRPTFRGGNIGHRWGSFCIQNGDSGGPIYTINGDGTVNAKGIISGSSCISGLYGEVTFTDIRDPWLGLPGTIRLG